MKKKAKEMTKEERVGGMITRIQEAAIEFGLNIAIYEGKIGFVDQKEGKIVALWSATHKMSELKGANDE